jgi:hypothetical protein
MTVPVGACLPIRGPGRFGTCLTLSNIPGLGNQMTVGNMPSDLDIPLPPPPAVCLRSLSQRLNDALTGGGAFDSAGYDARRIVREAAKDMLRIAAAVEHDLQPEYDGTVLRFARDR